MNVSKGARDCGESGDVAVQRSEYMGAAVERGRAAR